VHSAGPPSIGALAVLENSELHDSGSEPTILGFDSGINLFVSGVGIYVGTAELRLLNLALIGADEVEI
jgi:hypothetical protein